MIRRALTAALLALIATAASAAPARRPRTALVLSGGGIRGAAHIGVLKVLEELRIPVDFVVGTSMGSLVGGLYASGLSPAELQKFYTTFNWDAAFDDNPPRDNRSFKRKQDDLTFLLPYRIGFRNGHVRFPLGAIEGQAFLGEFRKLGQMTQELKSFDELPIPFRPVATDLINGETVVISSGDVALAIRASVAISPVFTPVEYQGRLLVDGGYLDNIPVDVARALGAERVIVVNIGTPLSKRSGIQSVFDVLTQTGRMGGEISDRIQLGSLTKKDLLIQPDLEGFGFLDFARIPETIKRGEDAARALTKALETFSVSEEEYKEYRNGLKKRPSSAPVIDGIEIKNGARLSDEYLKRMVSQPLGRPLDAAKLQRDLARINGLGYFDYVDYTVVRRADKNVLVVKAPARSWGPGYLRFGLQLTNDFKADNTYEFAGRLTRTDINSYGAEWQTDAEIGTDSYLRTEFHEPFDYHLRVFHYAAPVFIAPRVEYDSELVDLVAPSAGQNAAVRYRLKAPVAAVDLGHYLSNVAELRAGIDRSWNKATAEIGTAPSGQSTYRWNGSSVYGRMTIDTLDHPGFPREGVYSTTELRDSDAGLGSGRVNKSLDARGAAVHSFGRHTFGAKGIYSTNLDVRTVTPRFFTLGGLFNLGGLPTNYLWGTNRVLGQLRYYWNPTSLGPLPFYLGSTLEWGGAWNSATQISLPNGFYSGTAFIGFGTAFGPMYFAYSRTSHDHTAVTFYLGYLF